MKSWVWNHTQMKISLWVVKMLKMKWMRSQRRRKVYWRAKWEVASAAKFPAWKNPENCVGVRGQWCFSFSKMYIFIFAQNWCINVSFNKLWCFGFIGGVFAVSPFWKCVKTTTSSYEDYTAVIVLHAHHSLQWISKRDVSVTNFLKWKSNKVIGQHEAQCEILFITHIPFVFSTL